MDFADNKLSSFTKKIIDLIDQPNMQPDELKAYFDSSPEEVRQAHNSLCDALTTATSAATSRCEPRFPDHGGRARGQRAGRDRKCAGAVRRCRNGQHPVRQRDER